MTIISNINKAFYKDNTAIYYLNYLTDKFYPLKNADYDTFEIVNHVFAKDKNNVYAMSSMKEGLQIFEDADMPNVVFISEFSSAEFDRYFADNQNLYHYNGHFIEYLNTMNVWTKEEKIVQFLQQKYPDKKAWWNYTPEFYNQLVPISTNHYRNNDTIFYFFKDDKDLYDYPTYNTKVSGFNYEHEGCFLCIKDADIETFEVLNEIYSKDKNYVYFHSIRIKADPDTFKIIDQLFAKDMTGIWYNGRLAKIILDPPSFEVITKKGRRCDGHLAKDKFTKYSSEGKTSRITYKGYATILKKLKDKA